MDDLTPTTRALVPNLMGGTKSAKGTTMLRPAYVENGTLSKYVVPGDWPKDPKHWFNTQVAQYPSRTANSVEYYIDGHAAFDAMVEAIETADKPEHFIVLVGWTMHLDFEMVGESARCKTKHATAEQIFLERAHRGVKVRLLVWDNLTEDTSVFEHAEAAVAKMNVIAPASGPSMPPAAILIRDVSVRGMLLGSHHQKILLVNGKDGLVGFFGGVDINSDRVKQEKVFYTDVGGPLHDVHARVQGEAAQDLLSLVALRWNESFPEIEGYGHLPTRGQSLDDLSAGIFKVSAKPLPTKSTHVVQIGQTVGNPRLDALGQKNSAWQIINDAIQGARKFIYMEDQYLWSILAGHSLGKAAANVKHITILMTKDDVLPPNSAKLRYRALRAMFEAAGEHKHKIGIYTLKGASHTYVHAKMFVMDDELAIIGSANANNRGYLYDSEVIGAIADPAWNDPSGPRQNKWYSTKLNFAHMLRMQLWQEHLGLDTCDVLLDGVASGVLWRYPLVGTRAQTYTIDKKYDWIEYSERQPEVGTIVGSTGSLINDPEP